MGIKSGLLFLLSRLLALSHRFLCVYNKFIIYKNSLSHSFILLFLVILSHFVCYKSSFFFSVFNSIDFKNLKFNLYVV